MKKFIALSLLAYALSPSAQDCRVLADPLFGVPAPIEATDPNFLPGIFSQLGEIAYDHRITVDNTDMRNAFRANTSEAHRPGIQLVWESADYFGTDIASLLKHAKDLKSHILPSQIKNGLPPAADHTLRKRLYMLLVHRALKKKIVHKLYEERIPREELIKKMGIPNRIITILLKKRALPRFPTTIRMVVGLDEDVIDFFRRVEIEASSRHIQTYGRRTSPQPKLQPKMDGRISPIIGTVVEEALEVFQHFHKGNASPEVVRFRNLLYDNKWKNQTLGYENKSLASVIQMAHFMGMVPSEMIRYAGELKSRIRLDGIQSRYFLSKEQMIGILEAAISSLRETIEQAAMEPEDIAHKTGLSSDYIKDIVYRHKVPSYDVLDKILIALNSDIVTYFQRVESSERFRLHYYSPPEKPRVDRRKKESSQFIGRRMIEVQSAMRSIIEVKTMEKILYNGRHRHSNRTKEITEQDPLFKTIYGYARLAGVPLAAFVGRRPLKAMISIHTANVEKVSTEEIRQAKQYLGHLILMQAIGQNKPLQEVAIRSRLTVRRLQYYLEGKQTPTYEVLRRLVEDGFGTTLEAFLENFEEGMRRFDPQSARLHTLPPRLYEPYLSEKVQGNIEFIRRRFYQTIDILRASGVSFLRLRKQTGLQLSSTNLQEGTKHSSIEIAIKLVHFAGITLKDFADPTKDLARLIDPSGFSQVPLSREDTKKALMAIKDDLGQARARVGLSEAEVNTMMGAYEPNKFSYIFRGQSSLVWLRFFQAAEAIAPDDDPSALLAGASQTLAP